MRKAERKNVDAFEMWCWRRVTWVYCMERLMYECSNTSTRMDTGVKATQTALRYFGHVVILEREMENVVMLGQRR